MGSDRGAIRAGLALLGPQAPRLDPKLMVKEIRDRVGDELDYRIEAGSQQQFHTLYAGHPFIHTPAVHSELSTSRVPATDYVQGRRWAELTGVGDTIRSRWGETVFRFVFVSLYRHGLFNADPHPGHYLFHRDGTVTFLDFGSVKRFTAERVSGCPPSWTPPWPATHRADSILLRTLALLRRWRR